MICGTTPTHIFKIPFDTSQLKEIRISYAQDDAVIVEKTTSDCVLEGDKITVTLSQADTLKFSHQMPVEIQLKVLTVDGCVLANDAIRVRAKEVLNKEVLT